MTLQSIKYESNNLVILDQLDLPHLVRYVPIKSSEEGWRAIKEMQVRGAPAIAIVAVLSLASELNTLRTQNKLSSDVEEVRLFIAEKLRYLETSRPTAVNLSVAAGRLNLLLAGHARDMSATGQSITSFYINEAEHMLEDDLINNQNIGKNGADWILDHALLPGRQRVSVLTHCNTGALATAGYGTALGIIRALYARDSLDHVYCTETRPYNQGARLTAFELVHEKIPSTLITDSMAAALLSGKEKGVSAIIVGADRVAANGDTANKIGTYGLAVLAKFHGVRFIVAAPLTTIDLKTRTGDSIVIEERPASEVTTIKGPSQKPMASLGTMETIRIAAPDINVWNPAFDVTPASLIDAIVTEVCVVEKGGCSQSFELDTLFHHQ